MPGPVPDPIVCIIVYRMGGRFGVTGCAGAMGRAVGAGGKGGGSYNNANIVYIMLVCVATA